MAETYTRYHAGTRRPMAGRVSPLRIALAVGFAVVLWGGYQAHWSWTGLSEHTATLWDWLNLLLLPVTVGLLPIWLRKRQMLTRRHKLLGTIGLVAFVIFAVVAYTVPWAWTGFVGNTMWDWLHLLLLPLVVAALSVWSEIRSGMRVKHQALIAAGLMAFVVAVLGGYLGGWQWTGFKGNTLWDWLHLLLLPLAIPALVVPAVVALTNQRLAAQEEVRRD